MNPAVAGMVPAPYLRTEISDCSSQPEVATMKWETPTYNDIRFGFEVTMYINNK
jgi:pyrroloquinoline quinone biosynthesis protein A